MAYSKNRRLAEIISDVNGNLSVQGLVVPTQSSSDNDTSAASTAFVGTAITRPHLITKRLTEAYNE